MMRVQTSNARKWPGKYQIPQNTVLRTMQNDSALKRRFDVETFEYEPPSDIEDDEDIASDDVSVQQYDFSCTQSSACIRHT